MDRRQPWSLQQSSSYSGSSVGIIVRLEKIASDFTQLDFVAFKKAEFYHTIRLQTERCTKV
jgi:hypothetical protein